MPIARGCLILMFACCAYRSVQAQQDFYPSQRQLKQELQNADNDSLRASIWISLSNSYLEFNLLDSSLWAAQQAKALAVKANLPLAKGWAEYMVGAYYFYEGRYDDGIRIEQHVVALADSLQSPLLKANAQKLIGWMYTEMGKEEEALDLFKVAIPVFKRHRFTDLQMNVGIGYYGIATAYFYLDQLDSALLYYDSAITATPRMDSRELALALADRAAVLLDYKQDVHAAFRDVEKANVLLENQPLQNDAQAYVQAELARVYAAQNKLIEANHWAQSAYNLYSQIPLVKRYASVYRTLSEAFSLSGNYKMAYQVEYETRMLNDSIYQWRKLQVIEDLKAKYESDKKNSLITQLEFDTLLQKNVIIKNRTALFVLSVFFALLVGMALAFYRKREKYHSKINKLESAQRVREERDRIARELHDSLGGQLSSISIGLGRVQQQNGAGVIEGVQVMADRAMHELRDSLWVLNKESILLEELEQRINTLFWQYRKIETPVNLEAQFESGLTALSVSSAKAGNIYRIVQEALSNTVKHSGATEFNVSLSKRDALLLLEISDNGHGFLYENEQNEEHFGLRNMKKRAAALQATYSLSSTSQGTRIVIAFDPASE
jgi:signal transduction histidine kinase